MDFGKVLAEFGCWDVGVGSLAVYRVALIKYRNSSPFVTHRMADV